MIIRIQLTNKYAISLSKHGENTYYCSLWVKKNNEWFPTLESVNIRAKRLENEIIDFRTVFTALKGSKSPQIRELRNRVNDILRNIERWSENCELEEYKNEIIDVLNDVDKQLLLGE